MSNETDSQASWHPNPTFWSTLSRAQLTHLGLQEFDYRVANKKDQNQLPRTRTRTTACTKSPPLTRATLNKLQQFAQDGGPDLSHLRGLANISPTMSQASSKRLCGPDNEDFEYKLKKAGVYLQNRASKPANWQEIHDRLALSRSSLSSSTFGDQQFDDFQQIPAQQGRESTVMLSVMPVITGRHHVPYASGEAQFNRIQPIAKGVTTAAPDLYDGASPWSLCDQVRSDLGHQIVPTSGFSDPVAPNFFTEVKSAPRGVTQVATRQAAHDGAIGARAMHALQNYGNDTTVFDGNAYSFSNTFHNGHLMLYAHHPTAPKQPGDNPEYHMTQIRAFATTDRPKTFREAATAYRNLRDYAKETRDSFIDQANKRA